MGVEPLHLAGTTGGTLQSVSRVALRPGGVAHWVSFLKWGNISILQDIWVRAFNGCNIENQYCFQAEQKEKLDHFIFILLTLASLRKPFGWGSPVTIGLAPAGCRVWVEGFSTLVDQQRATFQVLGQSVITLLNSQVIFTAVTTNLPSYEEGKKIQMYKTRIALIK